MYQSRYHYSNGYVGFAVDSLSGEILEINKEATGENFIKNSCFRLPQPFVLYLNNPDATLFPPSTKQLMKDKTKKADIHGDENGFSVHYSYLTDGNDFFPADVTYTVAFCGTVTTWNIHVGQIYDGRLLREVKFPCLNGIWLGEDWEDDSIVYPIYAGVKWDNPVEYLEKPQKTIQWRWQEYRYGYPVEGCCGHKSADGTYTVRLNYPGSLSMSWFDYYDKNGGIYFASHDPEPAITALQMSTFGTGFPGMNFAVAKEVYLESGTVYDSPDRVVAFHDGDWHDGAEIYRAFREPLLETCPRPAWFEKSVGLFAHYDFKYQSGNCVHRYEDIPTLKKEAEAYGLDHILLSGWHKNGFDRGFPLYTSDDDLGTEDELAAGVCSDDKMHVTLYVNSRIYNTAYGDVSADVVIKSNGEPCTEKYGDDSIVFGAMCSCADGWQNQRLETARHIREDYHGAGVYFDQLSSVPLNCYAKNHRHKRHDMWCEGQKELLRKAGEMGLALMGEMVCDQYGGLISGQLMQSFYKLKVGVCIEMYRYTFPNHQIVDMLYPGRNLAMRPVFVAQSRDFLMHSLFTNGCYYWIYDLVDDNTFSRDTEGAVKLKRMIALRHLWLDRFGHGIFRDTKNLSNLTDDIMVRYYEMEDGCLLACANNSKEKREIKVSLSEKPHLATAYTPDTLTGTVCDIKNGTLTIPADEFSVIRIV